MHSRRVVAACGAPLPACVEGVPSKTRTAPPFRYRCEEGVQAIGERLGQPRCSDTGPWNDGADGLGTWAGTGSLLRSGPTVRRSTSELPDARHRTPSLPGYGRRAPHVTVPCQLHDRRGSWTAWQAGLELGRTVDHIHLSAFLNACSSLLSSFGLFI